MMGSASRNAPVNAPDLEGWPLGGESPGPLRYNTDKAPSGNRLAWAPDIDKASPKYTIGKKTKVAAACSQTPERVGPGAYPAPEAYGPQWKSEKLSLPSWSMNRSERWREPVQHGDAGRLWDAHGDIKMKFNRTSSNAPSFSFGNGPRVAKKVGVEGTRALSLCAVEIGRTPRGSHSRKGVFLPARCLLESPFLEPLLRTLLRTPPFLII